MIDPLLDTVFACCLAALFASTAAHKVREGLRFQAQLSEYRLVPESAVAPAAYLLTVVEACLALALLVPVARGVAALFAGALIMATPPRSASICCVVVITSTVAAATRQRFSPWLLLATLPWLPSPPWSRCLRFPVRSARWICCSVCSPSSASRCCGSLWNCCSRMHRRCGNGRSP